MQQISQCLVFYVTLHLSNLVVHPCQAQNCPYNTNSNEQKAFQFDFVRLAKSYDVSELAIYGACCSLVLWAGSIVLLQLPIPNDQLTETACCLVG